MGIRIEERQMGQRYAKHQMESGVRLYHNRHYQQAIERWRSALQRLRSCEDRFVTIGYIAQAFCDAGDYESMLHYALQQMQLANSRHDDFMKSEAFLNLSKAYERLADFGKAINYARASLQHPNMDSRTPGYAHSIIALAHLGFSQFQSSLEAFEKAMCIANNTGDKLLELQICIGLGALFTLLRDLNKSLIFLRNALSILQLVTVDNVHAKYKCSILLHLSVVLRRKGALADAHEACEEALRLAQQTGNRSIYARCLCSMADINRELGETEAKETITKSWARYEQSFRMMREINDRMGEVIVLGSMAKSASESRSHYTGQCECQAIQLNKKCLELAKIIGCKHAMLKCHQRLQELYNQLVDEESEELASKSCVALIQEMELFCNFCGQRYGIKEDSLQALRCSHIFHEKCLQKFLAHGDNQSCPKCRSRAVLMETIEGGDRVIRVEKKSKNQIETSLPNSTRIGSTFLNLSDDISRTTIDDCLNNQPSTSAFKVSSSVVESPLKKSNLKKTTKKTGGTLADNSFHPRRSNPPRHKNSDKFCSVDHLDTPSTSFNPNPEIDDKKHYSSQILAINTADQQLTLAASTNSISFAIPTYPLPPLEYCVFISRNSGREFVEETFKETPKINNNDDDDVEASEQLLENHRFSTKMNFLEKKILPESSAPKNDFRQNCSGFPTLSSELLLNDKKAVMTRSESEEQLAEFAKDDALPSFVICQGAGVTDV